MSRRGVLEALRREAKFVGTCLGFLVTCGCILGAAWGLLTYSEDKL